MKQGAIRVCSAVANGERQARALLKERSLSADADSPIETSSSGELSEPRLQEVKAPPISRVKRENIAAIRKFFESIGLESVASTFLTQYYDMAETFANINENDLRELFNLPGDNKPTPSKPSLTKGQMKLLTKYLLNQADSPIKLSFAIGETYSLLDVVQEAKQKRGWLQLQRHPFIISCDISRRVSCPRCSFRRLLKHNKLLKSTSLLPCFR